MSGNTSPTTWQKCKGELFDREGTFAVELLTLFPCHAGKEAKVVLLTGLLVAAGLKFALDAMPIQYKVGQRGTGRQRDNFFDTSSYLAR